jgi:hypothetical protein
MLAFIVAIPMLAINGSSFPEKGKKLFEKIWPTITSAIGKTHANISPEAPAYIANSQNQPSATSQSLSVAPNLPGRFMPENQPDLVPTQYADNNTGQTGIASMSSVVPVGYQSAIETPANGQKYNNSSQPNPNPFMAMQDRLRQLGATYYLLETWGNQKQYYRFYCQMAVGGNNGYTHYFEATNANPLDAMAEVLHQVEAWRGGTGAF